MNPSLDEVTLITELNIHKELLPDGTSHQTLWVFPGQLDPNLQFEEEKQLAMCVAGTYDALALSATRDCLKNVLEFLGLDVYLEDVCDD